jgi:hypothetical protein
MAGKGGAYAFSALPGGLLLRASGPVKGLGRGL